MLGIGVIEMVVFASSSFDTIRLGDAVNTLAADFLRGETRRRLPHLNEDTPISP